MLLLCSLLVVTLLETSSFLMSQFTLSKSFKLLSNENGNDDEVIRVKIEEWKKMKKLGILKKIGENENQLTDDFIEKIDQEIQTFSLHDMKTEKPVVYFDDTKTLVPTVKSTKHPVRSLLKRRIGLRKQPAADDEDELEEEFGMVDAIDLTDLTISKSSTFLSGSWHMEEKYKTLVINGTSVMIYSFLNELKDKAIYDEYMICQLLLSISRRSDSSLALNSMRVYIGLCEDGKLSPSFDFCVSFINSCYVNKLVEAGDGATAMLLRKEALFRDDLSSVFLSAAAAGGRVSSYSETLSLRTLPGTTSAIIYNCKPSKHRDILQPVRARVQGVDDWEGDNNEEEEDKEYSRVLDALDKFKRQTSLFSIKEVNLVLRALGRNRFVSLLFDMLDFLHQGHTKTALHRSRATALLSSSSPLLPEPDDESYEFLSNALVGTVKELAKSKSMKDLPPPDASMPEVVFVGRSNVGKSSLVNFLVNRKALASTSATPGHTTQFHFYGVNEGHVTLPSFYLIDVPGLGYAEVNGTLQDSWRSLLERYLSVRDPLCAVFHLIDSRHKITGTDAQMIEMATRAAAARAAAGLKPFSYSVVLTKSDKCPDHLLERTLKDVKNSALAAKLGSQTPAQQEPETADDDDTALNTLALEVVQTSVHQRSGRLAVWRLLVEALRRVTAPPEDEIQQRGRGKREKRLQSNKTVRIRK